MRKVIAATALLVAAGCAHVTPVTGPDGRPAYAVRCGTWAEACYQKAGELCPHGYDLVDREKGGAIVGTPNGLVGGTHSTLLIECK